MVIDYTIICRGIMNTNDLNLAKTVGKFQYPDKPDKRFAKNIAEAAERMPDMRLNLIERLRLYRIAMRKKTELEIVDKDLFEYASKMLILVQSQVDKQAAVAKAQKDRIQTRTIFEQLEADGRESEPIIPGSKVTLGDAYDPENEDNYSPGTLPQSTGAHVDYAKPTQFDENDENEGEEEVYDETPQNDEDT